MSEQRIKGLENDLAQMTTQLNILHSFIKLLFGKTFDEFCVKLNSNPVQDYVIVGGPMSNVVHQQSMVHREMDKTQQIIEANRNLTVSMEEQNADLNEEEIEEYEDDFEAPINNMEVFEQKPIILHHHNELNEQMWTHDDETEPRRLKIRRRHSAGLYNYGHEDSTDDNFDDAISRGTVPTGTDPQLMLNSLYIPSIINGQMFKFVSRTEDGKVEAECQLCNPRKIIKGLASTSSNFITHLKRVHREEYDYYSKNKSVIFNSPSSSTSKRKFILNVGQDQT